MYTILTVATILFLWTYIASKRNNPPYQDETPLQIGITWAFVWALVTFVILIWARDGIRAEYYPSVKSSTTIIAMNDSQWTNVQWGGFLTLSITSSGAQRYYYALDNGKYKTVSFVEWIGEKIRIFEEDRKDGRIDNVVQKKVMNPDNSYAWYFPAPEEKDGWIEIHIPKGTVKNDYSVDLK